MSKPSLNYDRRSFTRSYINSPVKYKLSNDDEYDHCIMLDSSHSGLLISLDREVPIGQHIEIKMESELDYEGPIEISAEIVRRVDSDTPYVYHYGCLIHRITGI